MPDSAVVVPLPPAANVDSGGSDDDVSIVELVEANVVDTLEGGTDDVVELLGGDDVLVGCGGALDVVATTVVVGAGVVEVGVTTVVAGGLDVVVTEVVTHGPR